MPQLPVLKAREIVRALERAGFVRGRQAGSHLRMHRGDTDVTVPLHGPRDVKRGTLASILRQAELSVDEFLDLLKR